MARTDAGFDIVRVPSAMRLLNGLAKTTQTQSFSDMTVGCYHLSITIDERDRHRSLPTRGQIRCSAASGARLEVVR